MLALRARGRVIKVELDADEKYCCVVVIRQENRHQ